MSSQTKRTFAEWKNIIKTFTPARDITQTCNLVRRRTQRGVVSCKLEE